MLFNTILRVKPYQFLHKRKIINKKKRECFNINTQLQVLHGCRQSVLWKVRLTPLTDEIPALNLYLTVNGSEKVPFGAKTSRYGPHGLGYRRAAKTFTKWRNTALVLLLFSGSSVFDYILIKWKGNKEELIIKESYFYTYSMDCRLQFGDMKKEFRVIVDH
jgi:hypothetical protein